MCTGSGSRLVRAASVGGTACDFQACKRRPCSMRVKWEGTTVRTSILAPGDAMHLENSTLRETLYTVSFLSSTCHHLEGERMLSGELDFSRYI